MKKNLYLSVSVLFASVISLAGCGADPAKTITVAASEDPHAVVLNSDAVQNYVKDKGYSLNVKVIDWTIQNDGVANGDYDANYFQHRPYLLEFNSDYSKVKPLATVHFEPLRLYKGKASVAYTDPNATFEICADVSNEIRALDLLKNAGIIEDYELDEKGNPINLPSRIKPIDENLLVSSLQDYDYAVLPANTALTGKLTADTSLPVEADDVADLRANVLAVNTVKYDTDTAYKDKIDVLVDALLQESVATFINTRYNNVIKPIQQDLRSK